MTNTNKVLTFLLFVALGICVSFAIRLNDIERTNDTCVDYLYICMEELGYYLVDKGGESIDYQYIH